jgi:hypothetical protein
MLPGPDLVLSCPSCGALSSLQTLLSGNTFGATVWTDGRMIAPMLPKTPKITRCHQCKDFFWVEDAEEVGKTGYGVLATDQEPEWRLLPKVRALDEDEFYLAIEAGLGSNTTREFNLRLESWWNSNDRLRGNDEATDSSKLPEVKRLNMERLLDLLANRGDDDEVLLFSAELYRELGRFDEAIKYASKVHKESLQPATVRVSQLALEKDTQVRTI